MMNQDVDVKCKLPFARIKTIVKSHPDIDNIQHDAIIAMTKATELFLADLALLCENHSEYPNRIEYNDLADLVHTDDTLLFLQEIVPKKIKASEALQIIKDRQRASSGHAHKTEDDNTSSSTSSESD